MHVMTGDGPISFARGAPSLDLIDVDGLALSAATAFQRDPAGTTAYGTAVGYLPLREWLADQHGVDPSEVMITNGSLQADALLFDALAVNKTVVVEDPTYDRTLLGLRSRNAKLLSVPLEADGLSTTELARLLADSPGVAFAHLIPTFHNPGGVTLSVDKRREVLQLAARHDFLVFEDDPYIHLRFDGEALPTMHSLDDNSTVVYASSFSKTVCPGIRVGYLVGPAPLIAELVGRATNTYLSPNMVAQSIVYDFCASGRLFESIERVKTGLRERRDALASALHELVPDATFVVPEGGYFLWVQLPDTVDADGLLTAAADHGVTFVRGGDFIVDRQQNAIRLAYSGVSPEDVTEGIHRLAQAINAQRS